MRVKIQSGDAPAAIGPYCQAIRAGDQVYTSGQLPLDPESGKVVDGGMEAQTVRVMKNARAVLAEAGCTFDNVVKTTVYITNLDEFSVMNEVYGRYFDGEIKPARSTVEVSRLAMGAMVEIEFIAVL